MIDRCKFVHNLPCEQVSERITELEEENANLMETVDTVMPSLIEDNAKLKVENEKLRKLCADMHTWMGRALYEGSARKYEYESITDCMDELGVPYDN